MPKQRLLICSIGLMSLAIMSCSSDVVDPARTPAEIGLGSLVNSEMAKPGREGRENTLDKLNARLAERGMPLAIARAEWLVSDKADPSFARTLFASDHFLSLSTRWVPGDERRSADGNNITYLVDQSDGVATPGLPNAVTEAAIDAAMRTWDETTPCSRLPIVKRPDTGADPDIIDAFVGVGDLGDPGLADIVNAGFLPASSFEALQEGASEFVIAVTFTLVFLDGDENPTDIDHNGLLDTALKEVWYNNNFPWTETGVGGVDIETVALHENGHALEMGHFGNLFITDHKPSGGFKIHASPLAVMNAAYLGPLRDLQTVDKGGHCKVFGSWPAR